MTTFGFADFAGAYNLGARMTHVRGVRPSVCQMLMAPQASLSTSNADLRFTYDGQEILFQDCAFAEATQQNYNNREGSRWVINILDRRWKWAYPKTSGVYNRRRSDGYVQTLGAKNARELATLLLEELGETGFDVSLFPTDAYPPAVWDNSSTRGELAWLCDLFGLTLVLRLDNTIEAVAICDSNSSVDIPLEPIVAPYEVHGWKHGVIPSEVRVVGGPDVYQAQLALTPVGRDSTGFISNSPSWFPNQPDWPSYWALVGGTDRHHAVETGWRWWRISLNQVFPTSQGNVSPVTHDQLLMHEHLVEPMYDDNLVPWKHRPVITGTFWPFSERRETMSGVYTGGLKVYPEQGLIETEYPLIQIGSGGEITAADIDIYIAYSYKTSNQFLVHTQDETISEAGTTTQRLELHHPELQRKIIYNSPYSAANDNLSQITAESDRYLTAAASIYDYDHSASYEYNGFLANDCSASVHQVEWACNEFGWEGMATTRMGLHTEFDFKSPSAAQRRAQNRLVQMAARMGLI